MNASKIITAVAVALLAATGAHAETYEGVHPLTSGADRSDVKAQAVTASHGSNPYAEAAGSGVAVVASTAERSAVRAQAVSAAHNPLQSLDRRAFYRDQVPAQYTNGSLAQRATRQASVRNASQVEAE